MNIKFQDLSPEPPSRVVWTDLTVPEGMPTIGTASDLRFNNGKFDVSLDQSGLMVLLNERGLSDPNRKAAHALLTLFQSDMEVERRRGVALGSTDPGAAVLCTSGLGEFLAGVGVTLSAEEVAQFLKPTIKWTEVD